jgi:hypothetical protein
VEETAACDLQGLFGTKPLKSLWKMRENEQLDQMAQGETGAPKPSVQQLSQDGSCQLLALRHFLFSIFSCMLFLLSLVVCTTTSLCYHLMMGSLKPGNSQGFDDF